MFHLSSLLPRPRPELTSNAALPKDTRLWAALQSASGGTWAGCVYDADKIISTLQAGRTVLAGSAR